MRRNSWLISPLLLICLSACLAQPSSPPALPTSTSLPPAPTPTATVIWFPASPTPQEFIKPAPALPLATGTPFASRYGDAIFTDDFTNPDPWSTGKSAAGTVTIYNHELSLVVSQPNGYLYSFRKAPTLTNFYAEITASPRICRGEDQYGLVIRVSPDLALYRYGLTCDGRTRLDKLFNGTASSPQPLIYGNSIPAGAPSTSQLAVLAIGEELHFYANDEFQFTVRDRSLTSGFIGVFARASSDDPVTVIFTDLVVTLPPK